MPADYVQNGFTFADAGSDPGALATTSFANLTTFYGAASDPDGPSSYISHIIDRSIPLHMEAYRLSATSATVVDPTPPGTGHGSPIATHDLPLADSLSETGLPAEVACVVSFHGYLFGLAEHSGAGPRPAERRRGRIYFGPLNINSQVYDPATKESRVNGALLTLLSNRANAALVENGLVIWSRKNALVTPATGGFVDNAFDTQRRRGEVATFRQNFGALAR